MQGIDRAEGRRLANDLQHITKRAGMPLAFLGAGLLELKHTLMRDRKMTFFHRCEHFDMPPLDIADATIGLAEPVRDAGGTITYEALSLPAQSADNSPHKLQVIGDVAWKTAGAPDGAIDTYVAEVAIVAAEKQSTRKSELPPGMTCPRETRAFWNQSRSKAAPQPPQKPQTNPKGTKRRPAALSAGSLVWATSTDSAAGSTA